MRLCIHKECMTSRVNGMFFLTLPCAMFFCIGIYLSATVTMNLFELIADFQCKICAKKFTRKDQLKTHMNQHLNIKKKCKFCGKELHPMSMARHQRSIACNQQPVGPKVDTEGIHNILYFV